MIDKSAYNFIIPFGKYKNKSFGLIAEIDPSYLQWIRDNTSFPQNFREAAFKTLNGAALGVSNRTSDIPRVEMDLSSKNLVVVKFDYNEELIERLKHGVDGAQFDRKTTAWYFHKSQLIQAIEVFGGTQNVIASDAIKYAYKQEENYKARLEKIRQKTTSSLSIVTKEPLFESQKVAIEFLDTIGGRGYIADVVGAGKTGTAIGFAEYKDAKKILVIVPKSLKYQWAQQIKRFTGKDACIWNSSDHGNLNCSWHIINYDIVHKLRKELYQIKYDLLICDEATKLKNHKAQVTKSIFGNWKLRKEYPGFKTKWAIFLTGTPLPNRPIEMFSILSYIDKTRFTNPRHFLDRYQSREDDGKYKNLEELNARIKDVMIRRSRAELNVDLPEFSRHDLYVDLDPADYKKYIKKIEELFAKWHLTRPSAAHMPMIRDLLFDYKFPRIIEFIDEMIDTGKSVLVYTIQQEHAYRIQKHYGNKATVITGNESEKEREIAKQKILNKQVQIAVYTIGTGSMGIDGLQTVIQDAIFSDMWWTPYIHEQAEGRIYRKSQLEKTRCWYVTVPGTVDEDMRTVLREKQYVIDTVIDGVAVDEVRHKSIFSEVIKRLQARKSIE